MYRFLAQQYTSYRFYFQKHELEQTLVLSCVFSVALALTRVAYTGGLLFLFLLWNLFLAFVPYVITRYLQRRVQWIERTPLFVASLVVWLLFIPNAFYIITDLFHLEARPGVPLWFDLALLFSFAWNGLLLGILSVRQMERLVALKWPVISGGMFVVPLMFLNALGIYIGRYLRYNSWDVVSNPAGLAQDVGYLITHPVHHRFEWSMICCFTVFMTFIYSSIKKMARH